MVTQATNVEPSPGSGFDDSKRGNGWLVLLLALLLVGAGAAYAGWRYADDQAKHDKAALQKQIEGLKAEADKGSTTLEIKEWGVKMTVDAELSDAQYVIEAYTSSPEDPGGGDGTAGGHGAYFTTASLVRTDSMCDAEGSSPLGGIFRTSTSPRAEAGAIRIGSYYYYYQNGHQSVCSGTAEAEEGARLLQEAFRTIRSG